MENTIIKNFIKIYFRENFNEIKYDLKTIENGFEIKFIDEQYLVVKKDNKIGWSCYGYINDVLPSEKVEEDFQNFFEDLNNKNNAAL